MEKEKTLEELIKERNSLDKIIEEKKQEEKKKKELKQQKTSTALIKALAENPELLEAFPHSRSSCATSTNSYFHNGYARCNRCFIDEMIENYEEYGEEAEYGLDLSVTLTKFEVI